MDDAGRSTEEDGTARRRFFRRPARGAPLEATTKAMDFCVGKWRPARDMIDGEWHGDYGSGIYSTISWLYLMIPCGPPVLASS